MCVACLEFIKNTLTFKEFKGALWEVTREDEEHLREVEELIRRHPEDVDRIRQNLDALRSRKPK